MIDSESSPPRTLISLLGEQTHPVLILTQKLRDTLSKVVIVTSNEMMDKGKAKCVTAAIASLDSQLKVEVCQVDPYDWVHDLKVHPSKELGNKVKVWYNSFSGFR